MNDETKKMILKLFMDNGVDEETVKFYSDYYKKIYQPNTAIIYSCRVEYEWAQLFLYLNSEKSYEEILEDNNKNNILDGIGYSDYLKRVSDRMIEVSKSEDKSFKVIFTDTLPNEGAILNQMFSNFLVFSQDVWNYNKQFDFVKAFVKNCQIEYHNFKQSSFMLWCTVSDYVDRLTIIKPPETNFNLNIYRKLFTMNKIIYYLKNNLKLVHKKVVAKNDDERKIKIIIENMLSDMLYDYISLLYLKMINWPNLPNFNKYININYDKMIQDILSKIQNIELSEEDKIIFIKNYLSDLSDRGFINIYSIGNEKYIQLSEMIYMIKYVRYFMYSSFTSELIDKNLVSNPDIDEIYNFIKTGTLEKKEEAEKESKNRYGNEEKKYFNDFINYYTYLHDGIPDCNRELDDVNDYIKHINYIFVSFNYKGLKYISICEELAFSVYFNLFSDMGLYPVNNSWELLKKPIENQSKCMKKYLRWW